jgi:hypothetical protein
VQEEWAAADDEQQGQRAALGSPQGERERAAEGLAWLGRWGGFLFLIRRLIYPTMERPLGSGAQNFDVTEALDLRLIDCATPIDASDLSSPG